MSTKKSNFVRAQAWTGTMTVKMEGTISGTVIELFNLIPTPELRDKVMAVIKEQHERLVAQNR